MKKRYYGIIASVLSCILVFALGIPAFAAAAEPFSEAGTDAPALLSAADGNAVSDDKTVFYEAGKGSLTIITGAGADESVASAAELLATYLEKILGKKPEIQEARGDADGAFISVAAVSSDGRRGGYDLSWDAAAEDTFFISGNGARGVFNGVFGFLRLICGVEIYSTDVKFVPESDRICSGYPYSYSYEPLLEYADTDWVSPHDLEFALANGLNGTYSPLEPVHGGKVNYIWFCHSLSNGIVPAGELFETHPEYFSLTERAGEREPRQLCLSNPEVVERAKQDVLAAVEEKYDPHASINIVSVTQDDNQDYCVCENCKALADKYGGQSGLMIWFVNQIAEAVEEKFPDYNLVVDTFAYQYTRSAPTGIRPRDNVCVRLCSIECCFSHALSDPDCEVNSRFMKDLSDWAKLSSRLYVWDYVTNFRQTLGIFPNFGVINENIKTFRENNVVGIYEEGAYYGSECYGEFFDLRAYLLSCDMREEISDERQEELTRGFCEAYYGEGAEDIMEILSLLTEHAGGKNGHVYIYSNMRSSFHGMTDDLVRRIDGLWASAAEKNRQAGNDAAAERTERSSLSWRYYKAGTGKGEYRALFGLKAFAENKKLMDDFAAFGFTRYNEGQMLADVELSPFTSIGDAGNGPGVPLTVAVYVLLAVVALLTLICAVAAIIRKRVLLACILLIAAVVAFVSGLYSGKLFVVWDNLPLYGLIDAVMLLTVAVFCYIAFLSRRGFAFPTGKKLVLSIIGTLTVAALPYELIVLLIHMIIYHGLKPVLSITVSSFCQFALIIASLIITTVSLLKKRDAAGDKKD